MQILKRGWTLDGKLLARTPRRGRLLKRAGLRCALSPRLRLRRCLRSPAAGIRGQLGPIGVIGGPGPLQSPPWRESHAKI
eukprot:8823298-Pyramimonas_sp.AAC.1